jgi:hypothetical protein
VTPTGGVPDDLRHCTTRLAAGGGRDDGGAPLSQLTVQPVL